jgi:hypothetical protein
MSSGSGRVAPPQATRPDAGVVPVPELIAIVAAAVLLWYLLGPVLAAVLTAAIAGSSASLSLLVERDDQSGERGRLAPVMRWLRWPLILLVIGLAVAAWFRLQRLSGLPEFRTYVVLYVLACPVGGLLLIWRLLAAGKRETAPVKEAQDADQAGTADVVPFHRSIAAVGGLVVGIFWAVSLLIVSWFVRLGLLTSQPYIERSLPPGASPSAFARFSVAVLAGLLHRIQQAPLGHLLSERVWPLLVAGVGLFSGSLIGFAIIGAIRPVLMVSSATAPQGAEPAPSNRRALTLPGELRLIRLGLLGVAVVVTLVASGRTWLALHPTPPDRSESETVVSDEELLRLLTEQDPRWNPDNRQVADAVREADACLGNLGLRIDFEMPFASARLTAAGDTVRLAFMQVNPADSRTVAKALDQAKGSCIVEWQAPYFRAIAVAAREPRVGDASTSYSLAVPARDGLPSRGPRYLFSVSRGWFLAATSEMGSKATLDQVLPGVFRHLDTELGTRFSARTGSARPPPSCRAVSPRLSDGSPLAIRDLAAVVTVHNLACGRDGASLPDQMADPFASDRGLLPPPKVAAAWKDTAVRRGVLRLLTSTLERPGKATADRVTYRLGDAAVAFTRSADPDPMHDGLRWSAFVTRCRKARPGIRKWCDADPGYEERGRTTGEAGALGSVAWTRTIQDVDCSTTGHGLEVDAEQYGDVTGDGKPEAFVAVACVPVTSSWPQRLEVFDGASDPSNPRRLATLLGYDDGTDERGLRIASITVAGRTVVVKSLGYHLDDPNAAGPRYHVHDSFTWDGGRFVRGPRKIS